MNRARLPLPPIVEEALVLLGAGALYVVASRYAAHWMVDDAGISFAYGIQLGQRGQLAPNLEGWAVEGFSNPLTVGVVALLSALRWFHPLVTPRRIAMVAFGVEGLFAFRVLRDGWRTSWWGPWLAVTLFLLLEVSTPATLIWYGSGLENGLLSMALVVLVQRLQVGMARGFWPRTDAVLLALAAGIRPEAPLYVLAWLAAAGWLVARKDAAARALRVRDLRRLAAWTAALLVSAAAIRFALFGALLPNTFYAKVTRAAVGEHLLKYVLPSLGRYWYAFDLSLTALLLLASRRLRPLGVTILLFSGAALALPLVGGNDWMGHHRFATAFLMLGHLSFAAVCGAAWAAAARPGALATLARAIPASLPAAFALILFAGGRDVYRSFVRSKYVGFALVADVEGFERVRIQRYLGLIYPVVALPDAGGSAVVGDLQLVDTAYLNDYQLARLRGDPARITQYELGERRVDLAEYHSWAFDKKLVGAEFLDVARFDAQRDFHDFVPAYAVRRELVETPDPGASPRVGTYDGIDAYLSDRTVLIGAPGAILRVEVLVSPRAAKWPNDCLVRVSVADSSEERGAFALSPLGEAPAGLTPGRYYRQGFLLQLPTAPGDYPLRVRLCANRDDALFEATRPVRVRAAASFSLEELRDAMRSDARAGGFESARWVAQLREQLVPRLAPSTRVRLTDAFRASYRRNNRTDVRAYDALVADSTPAFLRAMPGAVRLLEDEVSASLAADASRAWGDRASNVGARTLAVGRQVDQLRRLGFLGTARSRPWASLVRDVVGAEEPAANADDGEAVYERALGLALLLPTSAAYQRQLARRRVAE